MRTRYKLKKGECDVVIDPCAASGNGGIKMGCKYTIRFMRNGTCPYGSDRQTNNILRALWYLFTISLKYPIVDFQIRRGYIPCEECTADRCDKSPAFETEGKE